MKSKTFGMISKEQLKGFLGICKLRQACVTIEACLEMRKLVIANLLYCHSPMTNVATKYILRKETTLRCYDPCANQIHSKKQTTLRCFFEIVSCCAWGSIIYLCELL